MKALFKYLCLALILSVSATMSPIVQVQPAYAQDDDGGGGDDDDVLFPKPKPIVVPKKHHTAADIREYIRRWDATNGKADIVVHGAGRDFGQFLIINRKAPDLVARLLNRWRNVRRGNLFAMLREVKVLREETFRALQNAKKFGTPAAVELARARDDYILEFELVLTQLLEEQRKKLDEKKK